MCRSFQNHTFNLLGEWLQQLQPHLQKKDISLRPRGGIQTDVHTGLVSLHSCRCGAWTPGRSTPSPAASDGRRLCWRSLPLKPFPGEESEQGEGGEKRGIMGSSAPKALGEIPAGASGSVPPFTRVLCIMRVYVITVISGVGTRGLAFNVNCRGSHNWPPRRKTGGKGNASVTKRGHTHARDIAQVKIINASMPFFKKNNPSLSSCFACNYSIGVCSVLNLRVFLVSAVC